MKKSSLLFVLFATALGVINCSNSTEPEAINDSTNSSADIPAVFQKFTSNVKVSRDGDFIVLQTDDLPNHPSPYFGAGSSKYEAYNGSNPNFILNPNRIATQSIVLRIPVNPQVASAHQNTSLGPFGIALNGVVLFNQFAGGNQPLAGEINSFDQYNGHPQQTGVYHYHVEPLYLTAKSSKASLIGFLLDGFPVYGPEENGKTVASSALDQYHGHSHATAEYPNGIYHYHFTDDAPYINGGQYYGTPGTATR
jgi:YHYH protein